MFIRLKTHVKENKIVYVAFGSGVVMTALTVYGLSTVYSEAHIIQKINQIAWRPENNQVIINFTEKSTPSIPVHLVNTPLYFDSMSEAARKTGHSLSQISKNVNGKIPDVGGDIFERLELA